MVAAVRPRRPAGPDVWNLRLRRLRRRAESRLPQGQGIVDFRLTAAFERKTGRFCFNYPHIQLRIIVTRSYVRS